MPDEGIQRDRPSALTGRPSLPGDDVDVRRPAGAGGIDGMIPYKNPQALIAYYLGVFSLIPCLGLVLGPAAVVLGVLGLRFVRTNPTARGTAHAWIGIIAGTLTTLGNLAFIAIAILGTLLSKH